MSKKSGQAFEPRKIYPKTNISKAYYKHLVDNIEHDPLVKHSTLSVACLVAAVCVLAGALIWFAKTNPGNLIQTNATITNISTGKTDTVGTLSTFITFDFETKQGEKKSVRQQTLDGLNYTEGQSIKIGYHPHNPNYARNLNDNRPPAISIALWSTPFVFMIWFIFIAIFRHHQRQVVIWQAAEAADADE